MLQKRVPTDQRGESRTKDDKRKERAAVCQNKQAPDASHRRLNLTEFWFDERLPRQRSLVPGSRDEVAFARIATEHLAGIRPISAFVLFLDRFFIHIPVFAGSFDISLPSRSSLSHRHRFSFSLSVPLLRRCFSGISADV